jgi:hypothetical protein
MPYPDACRVLEAMFPGHTAAQLFEVTDDGSDAKTEGPDSGQSELIPLINAGFHAPGAEVPEWGPVTGPPDVATPEPANRARAGQSSTTEDIERRLIALGRVKRLSAEEIHQLASLAGNLVDLELAVSIDIQPDGAARVSYRQEVLNMTDRPLTRITRDLWFEHTSGKLNIQPLNTGERPIGIQRIHDTPSSAQFALQFSKPVQPGETVVASWFCEGVRFVSDHYWRQSIVRHTRHLTVDIRHRGGQSLMSANAVEGHVDGGENSIQHDLMWDNEDDDVMLTLTHDYLRPNQSVTVRWEVAREPAA